MAYDPNVDYPETIDPSLMRSPKPKRHENAVHNNEVF